MWDKLTAADFERIKRGLATRRSEMLARHAEELKGLEAQQSEIDRSKKQSLPLHRSSNSPAARRSFPSMASAHWRQLDNLPLGAWMVPAS
jgi:hypothetical protein